MGVGGEGGKRVTKNEMVYQREAMDRDTETVAETATVAVPFIKVFFSCLMI